jgi:drug/metabolite transporter (DMT)-like permease
MYSMENIKFRVRVEYLYMLVASFFWSLGHPLGRIIVRQVHPFQLGSITLSTGFIGLLLFIILSGKSRNLISLSAGDFLSSLGLGIFGFLFYQILTFSALARIPASMNAVLVSTNVVWIALLAALILGEKIPPMRIGGIILALIGVVFVTFNRGFSLDGRINLLGCSFSLLAAISFAFYSIFGKRVLTRNDPLIVACLALFSGSVLLVLLTWTVQGYSEVISAGWPVFLVMVFLGLTMIGIAYPLWFSCLKRLPASHVSIFIYLTPIFAVILSLIILKERFSWWFWLGGACIIGGIMITNMLTGSSNSAKS